jgi:hypothetical protein
MQRATSFDHARITQQLLERVEVIREVSGKMRAIRHRNTNAGDLNPSN